MTTLVAMPTGVMACSFTLDVLFFLCVLSANISMFSAKSEEFGTSLKKFFMTAKLAQALEQELKEYDVLDPLKFHLGRPLAKERGKCKQNLS